MSATPANVVFQLEQSLSRVLGRVVGGNGGPALPEAALRWDMPKDGSFGDLSNAIAFKVAA